MENCSECDNHFTFGVKNLAFAAERQRVKANVSKAVDSNIDFFLRELDNCAKEPILGTRATLGLSLQITLQLGQPKMHYICKYRTYLLLANDKYSGICVVNSKTQVSKSTFQFQQTTGLFTKIIWIYTFV